MDSKKPLRFIAGLVVVAVAAFLIASLATHRPHEGPFPDYVAAAEGSNACGVAGAYASAYALALVGYASYLVAGLLGLGGLLLMFGARVPGVVGRLIGAAFTAAALMLGLSVFSGAHVGHGVPGHAGGVAGFLMGSWFYRVAGGTGTMIVLFLLSGMGVALLAGTELGRGVEAMGRLAGAAAGAVLRSVASVGGLLRPKGRPAGTQKRHQAMEPAPAVAQAGEASPPRESIIEFDDGPVAVEPEEDLPPPEPEVVTRYTRAETGEQAEAAEEADFELLETELQADPGDYCLPPIDLLHEFASPPTGEDENDIREKGRILVRTLSEFNVGAQVVRVRRGPVITMYEVSLAPGTKVSKVESLADDLAISLKAPNVRIVAPLPGKNTVGIEVPNTERELVGVRELIDELGKKSASMDIPLLLGRDTGGNPLVLDLATCPHLLVAGATGSGKSVAINAMICSVLMTRTPDQVQLLLIDPKSVEFTQYTQLPHLICPVLSDMKKAASVLKWACEKMDKRYGILSSAGVRNLRSYNELGEEEIIRRLDPDGEADLDDVPFRMPHIVIIVDEFGELMMVAAKEVENSVIRLSQKARAVGIHLICATQRPSMDVITGLIKSNLPARIAFQVSSKTDSRIILDRNGGELLLGRGDMLLLPPGTSRLVRAQGSFVSEDEIESVVGFLEGQGGPRFRADLQQYHAQQEGIEQSDDLYDDAVRVVLESQRGSVSLLQRRLSIGYSRAARLIDMMAEEGIVGQYRGSQARRVLMSLEKWESIHARG